MRKSKKVSNRRQYPWWILAALIVIVGGTYAPVAQFGFVNWDDPQYVSENLHVLNGLNWNSLRWAATSEVAGNWHPLTMVSLMLDVSLFGLSPGAQHLVNVVFHLGATLLLFIALRAMTGAARPSAFVAAMFGVHPLHVESVAWISERKDVLSTFFVMAALCAYAWYARAQTWTRYLTMLALYCLALLAKSMVVTLPAVLLLLDGWPLRRAGLAWQDRRAWLRLVVEKVPMLVAALVVGVLTISAQGWSVAGVGALPFSSRMANALMGYGRYVVKTAWPASLSPFYPLEVYPATLVVLVAVAFAGATLGAIRAAHKWPFLLTGWLWFVITLLPVCGLVQTGEQAIADRYMYFPIVGLLVAIAWTADALRQSYRLRGAALPAAAAVLVVASAIVARGQVAIWADSQSLWRHAINVNDRNYRAHEKLGDALRDAGALDAAAASYRRALELGPANSPKNQAIVRNGLGIVLVSQGKTSDAISQFAEAVRLDPDFSEARINLGAALANAGRIDEAAQHYSEAVRLSPNSAEARLGLAGVRLLQGRAEEAWRVYTETIALAPNMAEAHAGLAGAAAALRRPDQVYASLAEAIRLKPGLASAHVRLANQLAADGRVNEAAQQLREALSIDPNQPAWREALARLEGR
jgi:protein O-mannosyl-transferase